MLLDIRQFVETGQVELVVTDEALPASVLRPENFGWGLSVDQSLAFCALLMPTHRHGDVPHRPLPFSDLRGNVADGRSWALALIESGPVMVTVMDRVGREFRFEATPDVTGGAHQWRRGSCSAWGRSTGRWAVWAPVTPKGSQDLARVAVRATRARQTQRCPPQATHTVSKRASGAYRARRSSAVSFGDFTKGDLFAEWACCRCCAVVTAGGGRNSSGTSPDQERLDAVNDTARQLGEESGGSLSTEPGPRSLRS